MVSPKNFTVGSLVTSNQALLKIFGLGNVFKIILIQARCLEHIPKAEYVVIVDLTNNHLCLTDFPFGAHLVNLPCKWRACSSWRQ